MPHRTLNNPPKIPIIKTLTIFLLLTTSVLSHQQSDYTEQQKQNIRAKQHQERAAINMVHDNAESYTFQSRGIETFIVEVGQNQTVQGEIYAYWNAEDIYITSDVKMGEDIQFSVLQEGRRMVLQKRFYTICGFSFEAQKGLIYTIQFNTEGGTVKKLITMSLSKVSPAKPESEVREQVTKNYEPRIISIFQQLRSLVTTTSTAAFLEAKINAKILSQSQKYMYYQIFEVLVVILVAVMQVIIIKKMLRTAIII